MRIPETAAVVGGGVVGLACALNLQARGIATTLIDSGMVDSGMVDSGMVDSGMVDSGTVNSGVLDSGMARPASWGNAGHIAVEQVEPLASAATLRSFPERLFWRGGALSLPPADIGAWLPFALRFVCASRPSRFRIGKAALGAALASALPAWRRLVNAAHAPHLLLEEGHFIVWETLDGARSGRTAWERAEKGGATIRDASDEELGLLASLMARPPAAAVRFSGTGQIQDLGDLAAALAARFAALGGVRRCDRAERLELTDGAAALHVESGEKVHADAIVIAAGVASAALLKPLGYSAPIIAERGYHIQSERTDWPADIPPVVFEERSMIVTRFRSGLRAASFVEFARADSPPDHRKWRRLASHVAALGLPLREPVTQWMGARPTLPDYLPAIGRSRRAANLFYAFGHQHLGLTLAAITGETIGALVSGEPSPIDLSAFDLERF